MNAQHAFSAGAQRHDETVWRGQVAELARQREAMAWRPMDRAGLARWKRAHARRKLLRNMGCLLLGWASMGAIALAVYLSVRG